EELAGLNTALANLLLALGNPIYVTALLLVAWWLLAPFVEAVNYLFHLDCQVRYFGLDLWYRLDRFFPALDRGKAGAVLVAAGLLLLGAAPAAAADRLTTIRQVRGELRQIIKEVEKAKPYPGGQQWAGRLDALGRRLSAEATSRTDGFAWFARGVAH